MSLIEWRKEFVFEHDREPSEEETRLFFESVLRKHMQPLKDTIEYFGDRVVISGNGMYLNANRSMFEQAFREVVEKDINKLNNEKT